MLCSFGFTPLCDPSRVPISLLPVLPCAQVEVANKKLPWQLYEEKRLKYVEDKQVLKGRLPVSATAAALAFPLCLLDRWGNLCRDASGRSGEITFCRAPCYIRLLAHARQRMAGLQQEAEKGASWLPLLTHPVPAHLLPCRRS